MNDTLSPLVSIIICVYNGEKYLERCLQSAMSQSYKNIEIIVVNDGSMDNTPVIIENYVKLDCRIIVISKQNGGISEARRIGVNRARGKFYVRWFDDYIERNGLHEEFARELALFHIKNTQARLHWKKVKDVNKEMNRLMIGLGDYPEFWKLLSRREKKIVTTYRLSSLLGYWRLYYYNWKNKL